MKNNRLMAARDPGGEEALILNVDSDGFRFELVNVGGGGSRI